MFLGTGGMTPGHQLAERDDRKTAWAWYRGRAVRDLANGYTMKRVYR
ncbi:hypothetical protein VD0004_g5789 [Verticillium dahliae]|uniref:Uncharacterized protein n=1 Tax=Verticillium dahliae TaxID=27337 RepID=A0AA45AJU1_VERDA|nr:hypothetical protein BJF96_g7058 [Verticillium dahliae]PNH41307.1 hypothetical protein VD0004_g5789 [Verticillium dahliae]PNH56915.1 hypothetical protein VD0003_g878 [Verticillium dahliae]PNH67152.1 hypothetical protein VD0001_g7908 [Verticillium dahliae]